MPRPSALFCTAAWLIAGSWSYATAAVGITGEESVVEGLLEDGFITSITAEVGSRIMIEDAWANKNLDNQFVWGLGFTTRGLEWPLGISAGFLASNAETTFSNGVELRNQLTQWYIGADKSWRFSDRFEANWNGGLMMVRSTLRYYDPDLDKRTATGFGPYGEVGISYIHHDMWQAGLSARYGYAEIDNISDQGTSVNAAGIDIVFTIGGRF